MSKILRIIQGYQPKDCGTSNKYKPPQGGSAVKRMEEVNNLTINLTITPIKKQT